MDGSRKEAKVAKWGWLPALMPGVARQMAEARAKHGDAHVEECWRRGVVQGEPNWFFAREGAIAVGTPPTLPELLAVCGWQVTRTQSLLVMSTKRTGDE